MGYSMLHKRVFVEELAEAMGIALPDFKPPDPERTDAAPWFEAALAEIREVIVPRSSDQVVVHRAKGLARLIKYLQSREECTGRFAADGRRDLERVLGKSFQSGDEGQLALVERIRSSSLDDEVALGAIHRQTLRDSAILASSMGALAKRHLPALA